MWFLLAPTSPLSDVEGGLILLRSTGAWMERLRQLIHEIHRRSLWQVGGGPGLDPTARTLP